MRGCRPRSRRPDEPLTYAAVYPRSRGKLYVDYVYLETILGPDLRRIVATDTVQLGIWLCMAFGVCIPIAV